MTRSDNGDHMHQPYNILNKEPDFSNDYGSTAVTETRHRKMLKDVNKALFSVKLKPGAVLAPHWNPVATEIGLVTNGVGEIRIVYPNGTKAFCEPLTQGMVFYVPRNFPMCHISSQGHPFEFVGFSTSSRPNHPQFVAGSNSLLHKWNNGGSLLAKSFNMAVKHFQGLLDTDRPKL